MFKKGQAAMEFLMTYGWAILVVLVAIGALAYFGVLSPDKFLPKKCTVSPGIACTDHKVVPGQVEVIIRNGLGEDMTNVAVYIPECQNAVSATGAATINNGDDQTYTLACVPALTTTRFDSTLNVTYTLGSSTLSHSAIGEIVTKVE